MNKNNAKDYLPLVQALADGKTIQYNHSAHGWMDINNVTDAFQVHHYRIKPEPLVMYAVMRCDVSKVYAIHLDPAVAMEAATNSATDGKVRKFVEVIED